MSITCNTVTEDNIIIQMGRDYVGTLSSIKFNGVLGEGDVTVTWELYDYTDSLIASGVGTYSGTPGLYTFTIESSDFDNQAPAYPVSFKRGRVIAKVSKDGVDGSFGGRVQYMYPRKTAV